MVTIEHNTVGMDSQRKLQDMRMAEIAAREWYADLSNEEIARLLQLPNLIVDRVVKNISLSPEDVEFLYSVTRRLIAESQLTGHSISTDELITPSREKRLSPSLEKALSGICAALIVLFSLMAEHTPVRAAETTTTPTTSTPTAESTPATTKTPVPTKQVLLPTPTQTPDVSAVVTATTEAPSTPLEIESEVENFVDYAEVINNGTNIRRLPTTTSYVMYQANAGEKLELTGATAQDTSNYTWHEVVIISIPDEEDPNEVERIVGWIRADLFTVVSEVPPETGIGGVEAETEVIAEDDEPEAESLEMSMEQKFQHQAFPENFQEYFEDRYAELGGKMQWNEEIGLYQVVFPVDADGLSILEDNTLLLIPQAGFDSEDNEAADLEEAEFIVGSNSSISTTVGVDDEGKDIVHTIHFATSPFLPRPIGEEKSPDQPLGEIPLTHVEITTLTPEHREELAKALSEALYLDPSRSEQVFIAFSGDDFDDSYPYEERFRQIHTIYPQFGDARVRTFDYSPPKSEQRTTVMTVHVNQRAFIERLLRNPEHAEYWGHSLIWGALERIVKAAPMPQHIAQELYNQSQIVGSLEASTAYLLRVYEAELIRIQDALAESRGEFVPVFSIVGDSKQIQAALDTWK